MTKRWLKPNGGKLKTILFTAGAWTAMSVPFSIFTGKFLALASYDRLMASQAEFLASFEIDEWPTLQ
jgi:hypothetical protein